MTTTSKEEVVKFRPRARVVDTIGGDLIKDEMAGVIELVKNSYDADATEVRITFRDLFEASEAEIRIIDDGHGMGKSTILGDWLSPATAVKEESDTSPSGRRLLGRKGIGRFAAMRLGNTLRLETAPGETAPKVLRSELNKRYVIPIDWARFKEGGKYLDEIDLRLTTVSGVGEESQGTYLVIAQLNDEWQISRIKLLIRELRLLLSPLTSESHDRFEVFLDFTNSGLSDEETKLYGLQIEPFEIPSIHDYHATATIDESGSYSIIYKRVMLAKNDRSEVRVRTSGADIRELFSDEAKKMFSPEAVSSADDDATHNLQCGSFRIKLHIWDRDPDILKMKGPRLMGGDVVGPRAVGQLLDQFSGVAIYRDGFRVRPYGDSEHDWIGLAQRRVQMPTSRIGPNQLFGIIDISREENPDLDDRSSREGLKDNNAYKCLRACVLGVLSWIEPIRYRFRDRHGFGRPSPKAMASLVEEREEALSVISNIATDAIADEKSKRRFKSSVNRVRKSIDREHERVKQQVELLHDMHALGLLARFLVHEGRNLDSSLDSALNNLERIAKRSRRQRPERLKIVGKDLELLDLSLTSSRHVETRLDAMLDQLDPLTRPRRRRRPQVVVEKVVDNVLSLLRPLMIEARIDDELARDSPGSHLALAWEADLFHALYNILHNSVWWVQKTAGPRRVKISMQRESQETGRDTMRLLISDSGPGVSLESAPFIFDLGYTEKPHGYGVGLFIASRPW